jgi:hypothetical protein
MTFVTATLAALAISPIWRQNNRNPLLRDSAPHHESKDFASRIPRTFIHRDRRMRRDTAASTTCPCGDSLHAPGSKSAATRRMEPVTRSNHRPG